MKNDFITNIVPGDVLFYRAVPKAFYLILSVIPEESFTFLYSNRRGSMKIETWNTTNVNALFAACDWEKR